MQYSDGLNWTHGSHSLKFGADIRQSMCDQSQTFQSDPQVLFTANYTGLALADFMIGRENSFTQASPNAGSPRTLEFAAYGRTIGKSRRGSPLTWACAGIRVPFKDDLNAISQFRPGQQSVLFSYGASRLCVPRRRGRPRDQYPRAVE